MLKREDFKNIYLIDKVAAEDMFHHSHFADSLWKYIKDNTVEQDKTPFNVGIFGKWGVGKSTVIKLFTKHLEEWNGNRKNNKKFKFIEFKVWKFSENALRRKFIFTIGKYILGEKGLNELYTEVKAKKTLLFPLIATPDYMLKAFRNWKENFPARLFGWLTFFSSVAFVSVLILNFQMKWNKFNGLADFTALFWTTYGPSFFISVISYIFKSINEAKVTVAFDQFDSEEQFEERFGELMESKKDEIKIIFIDDLDRCSKEKVIQTLETIKTYLDVPTCIFIIACDDAVICNVVRTKRSELCNEEGDDLEYLNKFFQHSIPIPPFIHQNMREYALQLLNKKENDLRKLPDVEEILRILIHTGVKTPRKAIAVINGFATDFEVVLRREEEKVLHPEYISSRLSTLAFFTAVKKDFRDFFDLLITDSNLIKYVLRIEEGNLDFIEEHHKRLLKEIYVFKEEANTLETSYKDNKAKEFVLLVQSARDHLADVDDFSPFIYLESDSSSMALSSERFRTLNSLLRDGITDKVRQMLAELKGEEDKRAHFSVIVKILGDIQSTAELRKAYRAFFEIAELMPGDDNFRQTASTSAMIKFPDLTRANNKWLEEFEIKGVMFLLKYLRSEDQKAKAIKELVNALEKAKDKELAKKWIKAILGYPELAPDQEVTRVKKILDRREPPAENKEAVFFTLPEICGFIKECQENSIALNRFFVGKSIEDILSAIIKLEEIEERDAAQEEEHKNLVEAFEILDAKVLSQKNHLARRIKSFILFLPTGEYYYDVVKKIPALISSLTPENSQGLLSGLVAEVPNVGKAENLKELLSLIDEISLKHSKPVESLTSLVKSLTDIASEKFEGDEFEISTNYFTKFIDDVRISEESAQSGYESLIAGLNGHHNLPKAQKIGNFILINKKQLKEATRTKIFSEYIRQILEQKTYDVAKFPNNEAIAYWDAVAEKIFDLVSDIDSLATGIVVNSGPLSAGGPLNVAQKSILMEILKKPWKRYSDAAKEHLFRLLIPYLKDLTEGNLNWGVDQIHSMLQKVETSEDLSETVQQEIVSALNLAFSKIKNESVRRNALSVMLFLDAAVVKIGADTLLKMLGEIAYQMGSGKDNVLAFEAFLKHHHRFSLEEQIKLCGLYLGSSVCSAAFSKKLIAKIKESLPVTPSIPIGKEAVETEDTAPKEVIATQTQEDHIEKYILNISADEKAWTFFAQLFSELKPELDSQLLREMATENIRKIKNEEEPLGVSRNRFSIICILKNEGHYSDADMDGLFNSLFSNDTRAKIALGCDFFQTYFPDIAVIRDKNSRNSYKHAIKQALERWKDDAELANRLNVLLD